MNNILIKCPVCRNQMHTQADLLENNQVKITCERCQVTLKEALVNVKAKEEKVNVMEVV